MTKTTTPSAGHLFHPLLYGTLPLQSDNLPKQMPQAKEHTQPLQSYKTQYCLQKAQDFCVFSDRENISVKISVNTEIKIQNC